ncbi:MAG TPA: hypothetical protein VHB79_24200 [Polyangiaceae bacterium]|nr:hypothetical protein [Polyangiaceae bacterium]
MTKVPQALLLAGISVFGTAIHGTALAQSPALTSLPAHPRIWLDAATLTNLKNLPKTAESPLSRALGRCARARQDPSEYQTGGWQGFEFVLTLSACLTAYEAAGSADDLATAIKYFRVLLDDYQTVGDAQGGDSVVTHDTGYAMRTFAPYSALAYDWLHDAPGVTEELRAHARARFNAWSSYYMQQGYLRDLAGANYQAGYAFAATLIAVAEAGEAGEAGDTHLANVRDVIWKKDLLPAMAPGGVLEGGDWPEGWQYGSLSVLEHALAARALQGLGVMLPGAAPWASALPLRYAHGLTPGTRQAFVGGDSDAPTPYRNPDNGPLLATIAGPGSADAKALARKLNAELGLKNENALFDALAAATSGPEAALSGNAATSYLAPGSGNFYVRSGWSTEASFSVQQCARHLVDDHQYANAGNWVLTRGADDLVVDPSPYGSLSTLTGNAPAIDSAALPAGYSPSQGFWGKETGFRWARQTRSGVSAARCDYADQFRRDDVPSDVQLALRDFVLLPAGRSSALVLLDRTQTGAPDRALHLRVRSPASLALSGDSASGSRGSSLLTIRKLWASSGAPNVRPMPQAAECPSSDHQCDVSKLPEGSEYRLDVAGPAASALHVIGATENASDLDASLLASAGYRGVSVTLAGQRFAVVASDGPANASPAALGYRAAANAVHVVLDAPASADGSSDVTATLQDGDCQVQITPHAGGNGLPGRPLIFRVAADCSITDDGEQPPSVPSMVDGGSGGGMGPALDPGTPGAGTASVGGNGAVGGSSSDSTPQSVPADASCALAPKGSLPRPRRAVLFGALAALGASRIRRRARRRRRQGV